MATPIAPTPILTGEAARRFEESLLHDEKETPERLEIMKKLNEYTAKWKAAENIDYSLYGTPLESTTYKFSKCLQKRFGIVEGVKIKLL